VTKNVGEVWRLSWGLVSRISRMAKTVVATAALP